MQILELTEVEQIQNTRECFIDTNENILAPPIKTSTYNEDHNRNFTVVPMVVWKVPSPNRKLLKAVAILSPSFDIEKLQKQYGTGLKPSKAISKIQKIMRRERKRERDSFSSFVLVLPSTKY